MNMIAAMRDTIELARANGMDKMEYDNPDLDFPHLLDMCVMMETGNSPQGGGFSEGKLGRWLGWAQAAVVAAACGTLDDMKAINKKWAD